MESFNDLDFKKTVTETMSLESDPKRQNHIRNKGSVGSQLYRKETDCAPGRREILRLAGDSFMDQLLLMSPEHGSSSPSQQLKIASIESLLPGKYMLPWVMYS